MPIMEDLYNKERAGLLTLDDFTYSVPNGITGLSGGVAGTIAPGQIQLDADSDFVCRYINVAPWQTATDPFSFSNATLPPLLISIQDTGSGRNWQNQPIPIQNWAGGSQTFAGFSPGFLPEPKMIVGSSIINITLTLLNALAFPRVDVSFVGSKVFYFGNQQRLAS